MSSNPTASDSTTGGLLPDVSLSTFLSEEETVVWHGLEPAHDTAYPDSVASYAALASADAPSFSEAIADLPTDPLEVPVYIDNPLVTVDDTDGSLSVDLDKITNDQQIDHEAIEDTVGQSLEAIVNTPGGADPLIDANRRKALVDQRRLALRTLFGLECDVRWGIVSSTYEAGDMDLLFESKTNATTDTFDNPTGDSAPFGTITYKDYGGRVSVTTIYPDLDLGAVLTDQPEDMEISHDHFEISNEVETVEQGVIAPDADGKETDTAAEGDTGNESETVTAYLGERLRYGFTGTQKLVVRPVIYFPEYDVVTEYPTPETNTTQYERRHTGNFMDRAHEQANNRESPVDWHESILTSLDEQVEPIEGDIIRANSLSVDFSQLPFDVWAFYQYLGLRQKHAKSAANRIEQVAPYSPYRCPDDNCSFTTTTLHGLQTHFGQSHDGDFDDAADQTAYPAPAPTIWQLAIGINLTLIEEFNGSKAGQDYQRLAEISGELLKRPAQYLDIALSEHNERRDSDTLPDRDSVTDSKVQTGEDQQTLAESLGDVVDADGVFATNPDLTEAQKMQRSLQRRLDN